MENLNAKQVSKVSESVHLLISQLFDHMREFEKNSRKLRIRINKTLNETTSGATAKQRVDVQKMIVKQVQEMFDAKQPSGTAAAAKRINVGLSGGCVGKDGGGVVASGDGFSVKVCGMGSLSEGITGGGVEGGWSY